MYAPGRPYSLPARGVRDRGEREGGEGAVAHADACRAGAGNSSFQLIGRVAAALGRGAICVCVYLCALAQRVGRER